MTTPALPATTAASTATAGASTPALLPAFPPFPGESNRAYEAFRAYLDLGSARRLPLVARQLGVTLRTVQRWAQAYAWRTRIQAHTAACADHYTKAAQARERVDCLDTADRTQALRNRQFALAEAILGAAENYVARIAQEDLAELTFADACKALTVASPLLLSASAGNGEDVARRSLEDQLSALLDQAYGSHAASSPTVPPVKDAPTPASGSSPVPASNPASAGRSPESAT